MSTWMEVVQQLKKPYPDCRPHIVWQLNSATLRWPAWDFDRTASFMEQWG